MLHKSLGLMATDTSIKSNGFVRATQDPKETSVHLPALPQPRSLQPHTVPLELCEAYRTQQYPGPPLSPEICRRVNEDLSPQRTRDPAACAGSLVQPLTYTCTE